MKELARHTSLGVTERYIKNSRSTDEHRSVIALLQAAPRQIDGRSGAASGTELA